VFAWHSQALQGGQIGAHIVTQLDPDGHLSLGEVELG